MVASSLCHVCGVPSNKFARKCQFDDHVQSHQNDRKFVCPFCGKTFKLYYALKHHQDKYHISVTHTCDTCGMRFSANSSLERHQKVHNSGISFVCEVCTKTFTRKDALSRHLTFTFNLC